MWDLVVDVASLVERKPNPSDAKKSMRWRHSRAGFRRVKAPDELISTKIEHGFDKESGTLIG